MFYRRKPAMSMSIWVESCPCPSNGWSQGQHWPPWVVHFQNLPAVLQIPYLTFKASRNYYHRKRFLDVSFWWSKVSFKAYNYRIEGDLNYRHYLNTTYTHFPHAMCNYGQERLSSFLANPWLNTSLAVCLKMCPKNSTTLFGIQRRHMAQSSNIFFFFFFFLSGWMTVQLYSGHLECIIDVQE